MAKAAMPKGGVMALHIKDKRTLYQSYLPFVKGGGIFIPTQRTFQLGDEVFLLLTLLEESERYPITGKVVWLTPKARGAMRPMGIGLQFNEGPETQVVVKKIEVNLGGMLNSDMPTFTM
ncbi:MAG: PilZ domain-containing protein [Candidatus Competibacterales bacterium]